MSPTAHSSSGSPTGRVCEGTLTALDDRGFSGTCDLPGGDSRTVSADWTVADGTVTGSISTTEPGSAAPAGA